MSAFDYMRNKLDELEIASHASDSGKHTFTCDDVRTLIDNAEKAYNKHLLDKFRSLLED